jgi:hypothetical protein
MNCGELPRKCARLSDAHHLSGELTRTSSELSGRRRRERGVACVVLSKTIGPQRRPTTCRPDQFLAKNKQCYPYAAAVAVSLSASHRGISVWGSEGGQYGNSTARDDGK